MSIRTCNLFHVTEQKLLALNEDVKKLQGQSYAMTHALDESIQHAMKHRQDTRAAAVIKNISAIAGAATSSSRTGKPSTGIKKLMFGQNFEEFKAAAKKTFLQMNLDDEAEEAKNNSSSANNKDDGYIHVKNADDDATPDIEAAVTLSSRSVEATPMKSRIEEELERVRRAGEEEMKAYTNQKENTRRPSLSTTTLSLDQSAILADSLPKPQAVNNYEDAGKAESQQRIPVPRSKASSMKSSREKETFFDADKQSVALERAKEVTKEGGDTSYRVSMVSVTL